MSKFVNETMQGLLEAIEMEHGNIPLAQRENMPSLTFYAFNKERELIEQFVKIRKEMNISQSQLAKLTGNKQQAISRIEKMENCPSLKLFYSMVYALGYELEIVKRI